MTRNDLLNYVLQHGTDEAVGDINALFCLVRCFRLPDSHAPRTRVALRQSFGWGKVSN